MCYIVNTMMELILGPAGTGKTAALYSRISALAAKGETDLVLLVPEQFSHEAERELCAAVGPGLSLHAEVMSFSSLARKVLEKSGTLPAVMDEGGRLLCMILAADELKLSYFQHCRRHPAQLLSILQCLDELRAAGVTPERMLSVPVPEGALKEKLGELACLAERFYSLEEKSALDPARPVELLAEHVEGGARPASRVFIDGFTDFTEREWRVLRALMAADIPLTLCLTLPEGKQREVFALPAQTAERFRREAKKHNITPLETVFSGETGEPAKPLAVYRDRLFSFESGEVPSCEGEIKLITAADRAEECELAAAEMRRLAANGCRWRDMAVAVRGFEDYRTVLTDVCESCGVPVFAAGRANILQKNLPTFVFTALETVLQNYPHESMFTCLKTGLAGFAPEELDEIENYVLLWNLRGQKKWTAEWTMHPEGYGSKFSGADRERLEKLNEQRRRIAALFGGLEKKLNKAATAAAQAEALAQWMTEISLPERLQRRAEELAERYPETAAETEKLWAVLCAALEQYAAIMGDSAAKTQEFAVFFSYMLSRYSVGLIPVSLDRVQVGEMNAMRRRHIRHLFVLGSEDSRIPAVSEAGDLFTEAEREYLERAGLLAENTRDAVARELNLLYNCAALPSESLWLSRPRQDAEGKETRPSVLTKRAMALFSLREEAGDIYAARAQSPYGIRTLARMAETSGGNELCAAAARVLALPPALLEERLRNSRRTLSPASVTALYGRNPDMSASRAEKFNDCRFAYFMRYGLRARERREDAFDMREYGSFLHFVVEYVARRVAEQGGFRSVERERMDALTTEAIEAYRQGNEEDMRGLSPRKRYLFERMEPDVRIICRGLWEEMQCSEFEPLALELDLSALREDMREQLRGRVDRVDGWVKEDTLYLRITDYKTGKKKFSLSEVCHGMDWQMLLYLFAFTEGGAERFDVEKIKPAGVVYAPLRHEVINENKRPSAEEVQKKRRGETVRSGLLLADKDVIEAMERGEVKRFLPVKYNKDGQLTGGTLATAERFDALDSYIKCLLADLREALRSGGVEANPRYKSETDNSCARCEYREACHFDEKYDQRRIMVKYSDEEAWKLIEEAEHE